MVKVRMVLEIHQLYTYRVRGNWCPVANKVIAKALSSEFKARDSVPGCRASCCALLHCHIGIIWLSMCKTATVAEIIVLITSSVGSGGSG